MPTLAPTPSCSASRSSSTFALTPLVRRLCPSARRRWCRPIERRGPPAHRPRRRRHRHVRRVPRRRWALPWRLERVQGDLRVELVRRSASCSARVVIISPVGTARRRRRGVGAGQGRRAWCSPAASCRCVGMHDVLLPHPVLGHHRAVAGPGRRSSPCSGSSGMANAINLIDGLDGLAAGIVAIAAGAFFLYGQRLDRRRACSRPTTSVRSSRDHRGRRRASASCRTTSIRRGSSWATAVRCCSAC